jgi:hypothetical protein
MKIAKVLKPYFKVLMTRVDNKRIKAFQVNSDKFKPKSSVVNTVANSI